MSASGYGTVDISQTPLFGQSYELTIKYAGPDGPTSETITCDRWEPEALKITFEVLQSNLSSPWWYADITIYNLNLAAISNIILNATWATLKAGFQTGPLTSSIIWDGPILQSTLTREAVVDKCVTLHCVANPFAMDQIVAFSMGPFSSQAQLVAKMASEISLPPINQENGTLSPYAAQALAAKQYPRGNTIFGKTGKYLSQISDDQFMTTWRNGQQAYISEFSAPDAPPATPDYVYSPPFPPNQTPANLPAGTTQSIIGTPRQTAFGVIFTVLLDPRLRVQLPPQVVQLSNVLLSQLAIQVNSTVASPLTANLTFFVSQVKHIGDSRGNDWYTEVTGFGTAYAANLLNGVFAATAEGA
jgi:hypothetical protein